MLRNLKSIQFGLVVIAALFVACNSDTKAPGESKTDKKDSTTMASAEELFAKYKLNLVTLPTGFSISVFAEVPEARSMCYGAKGTLFVGNREKNNVYAVTDSDNDGRADKVRVIANGLDMPNGVAFRNGSLYVAENSRIIRFDDIENNLDNVPKAVVVYDKFPDKDHHGWKFIRFGPDDKLYVPVGAPCNVCEEKDSIFSTITRMNPDGSGLEIYAKGVRNSVGFDWNPQTKELWFTDNGRDEMGDDVPNCELNYAPKKGMHFGFPYFHEGTIPDPDFGKGKKASDYIAPAQKMGAHVAPLGMRFYTGKQFPAEYTNKIFVALHGSWNRTVKDGYRVMLVTLDGNKVVKYEPFASGWAQPGNTTIGRPVDVEIAPDGALLVSDDKNGAIYRITYKQ